MSLTLVLNGQSRTFPSLPEPAGLDRLIAELGLQGDRVAVEHNGEIVPRTSWPQTAVAAGDRLEVVHFVGGGVQATD
ncbi:MAG TPA: sulfur carrier protein ThiS [Edaphobacter sp.]|nr:sulfur carrier protein ThiS [Edaphobacter sp.]